LTVSDILALKLISFNAVGEDNKYVNVNWSVAAETNIKEYVVQRSADGTNWSDLLTVQAKNNNDSTSSYKQQDNSPISGSSFYRIKMVDFGGNISYSNVQEVNMNIQQFSITQINPNPFHSNISIKVFLPEQGSLTTRLLDASGKVVRTNYKAANKGLNEINISDLDALSPGMYIVEVANNSKMIQQKVVKE
jgi:hypothetical protein